MFSSCLKPIPDPLPRPDASEYEEFKDYENVRTLGDDQDSDRVSVDNEIFKHDIKYGLLL